MPVIALMNTPQFRQKGLDALFFEGNPIHGKHPTQQRYLISSGIKDVLFGGISAVFPGIGFSYLSYIPVVVLNNRHVRSQLEKKLEE